MKSISIRLEEHTNIKEEIEHVLKYSCDEDIGEIRLWIDQNEESKFNFDVAFVKKYIDEINALYPNNNFKTKVEYYMGQKFILDTNKCKQLEEIDNYLRKETNEELYVSNRYDCFEFGFRKTLSANRKLDSIANDIKNASYNGASLSNFEKFMLAYEYVTNYTFKEDKNNRKMARHWVPVIEGDKIVCVGYASLLSALCDRIFPPNEVKVVRQSLAIYDKNKPNKYVGGHENNLIFIKDEKYGIDGLFYLDACFDSKEKHKLNKSQAFCCIPLKDVLHVREDSYVFKEGSLIDCYLKQNKEYDDFCKKVIEINRKKCSSTKEAKNIVDVIDYYLFGPLSSTNEAVEYYKNYLADVNICDKEVNAKTMINVVNKKANTKSIPVEAFVNSYNIIAEFQGLEGKKTKNYVKSRLIKSIKKTNEYFFVKKCESCFAKVKIRDKKKMLGK